MKIQNHNLLFIMIDVQEAFRGKAWNEELTIKNISILNQSATILEIPIFITEQYPKGLGPTLPEVKIDCPIYEKTQCSIFTDEIKEAIRRANCHQLVIYGEETHVCILQSVIDAVAEGYKCIVVADAVTSRTEMNRFYALERIKQEGGLIVTTEMLLFELVRDAKHPKFKEISKLVK